MESNYINIVPEWSTPIYHVSQNDDGRVFRCSLCDGGTAFELTGSEAVTLRYKKPSGTSSSIAVTNTGDDYVDVTIPAAMTDEPGFVYCKLRINSIGAKALYLFIEKEV